MGVENWLLGVSVAGRSVVVGVGGWVGSVHVGLGFSMGAVAGALRDFRLKRCLLASRNCLICCCRLVVVVVVVVSCGIVVVGVLFVVGGGGLVVGVMVVGVDGVWHCRSRSDGSGAGSAHSSDFGVVVVVFIVDEGSLVVGVVAVGVGGVWHCRSRSDGSGVKA